MKHSPPASSIPRYPARIIGLLAAVLIAIGLQATTVAPASAATMDTRQAQWNLAGLAYLTYANIDGVSGPTTQAAVKRFQVHQCMDADGAVGALTSGRLSAMMAAVQGKVGATPDGLNGPNTKAKIIAWQQAHGLPGDGMAGPATLTKMGLGWTRPCGGPIVGNIYTASNTVACHAGTTNLGVFTAYSSGTAISARLCAIPGFKSSSEESTAGSAYYISGSAGNVIVNSRVSGAVLGIFTAARNSGITPSAVSSFRTMAHQKALCNANASCRAGDYTYVARPGYSNHQLGVAIDFAGTNVKGKASCTNGRAVDRASTIWNYLERNARRFGFRQYAAESWHWDAMNSASRC